MSDQPFYNVFLPTFRADPYPTYSQMRVNAPIYAAKAPNGFVIWYVTRRQDVEALLKDKRLVNDPFKALTAEQRAHMPPVPLFRRYTTNNMLNADPPTHTRLRNLVSKAFTPRLIQGMKERVQAITNELLDAVEGQGAMDLIQDFAFPLPMTVISEMLGIPAADRVKFQRWSNFIIGANAADFDAKLAQREADVNEFLAYLQRIVSDRRAQPRNDLISALVQAEEAGDKLDEGELYSMIILLIIAGHETTVHLIGNAMRALWAFPEQLAKLKQDPSLMPTAIEEFLRYDGPVATSNRRWAAEEIAYGGQVIPRGSLVLLILNSANRDESYFADAEKLDISRANNDHLAFGMGIHYCVGAPLARMEGEIALNTLLRRCPNVRPADDGFVPQWVESYFLRGVQSLPVVWDK